MSRHALVVRPDSLGDVLVSGPAVRAVAAMCDRVTVLAGRRGADAARLLPGVDRVVVADLPWIAADPDAVDPVAVGQVVEEVRRLGVDEALVLTSFHQSALPTALLLRLAGVPRIAAVSEDYPGSLLDVRIAAPGDAPEPVRMAQVAAAAGYPLPPGDDGRPRLRPGLPWPAGLPVLGPFVVVHPGADAPARALPDELAVRSMLALVDDGWEVVVTGTAAEAERNARLVERASDPGIVDLTGSLTVASLAVVLGAAVAVVCGNTGPGHLAAAAGTPVVCVFAPVVPAVRWAPYAPSVVVLGDQHAPCRGTRARVCPVPGDPCVGTLSADDVVAAVHALVPQAVSA